MIFLDFRLDSAKLKSLTKQKHKEVHLLRHLLYAGGPDTITREN